MQNENFHSNMNLGNIVNIGNVMNQNNYYLEIISPSGLNKPKIKLDEILDTIKNLKNNYNIPEELRVGIKILKRFKLSECSKW